MLDQKEGHSTLAWSSWLIITGTPFLDQHESTQNHSDSVLPPPPLSDPMVVEAVTVAVPSLLTKHM